MLAAVAALTVCSLGVQVGWQPLESGGVEYIIQVSSEELERLANVDDLISDVPADLDVRRYRITVGDDQLPRVASWDDDELVPVVKADGSKPDDTATRLATATEPVGGKTFADDAPAAETADRAAATAPLNTTASTAKRPVSGTFADPEPIDEEEEYQQRTNPVREEPAPRETTTPARRDDLFDRAASTPLDTRLPPTQPREAEPRGVSPLPRYTEPIPQQQRYVPEPAPAERYASEPVRSKAVDQANEIPALPAFQTAQRATSERPASFDDVVKEKDSESIWGPVVTIFFFLLLSMGANMWLGWIAWEARMRYQMLLEKYRAMGGKTAADLV
jgi:hypothetical protein